jgi:hypothetical protein
VLEICEGVALASDPAPFRVLIAQQPSGEIWRVQDVRICRRTLSGLHSDRTGLHKSEKKSILRLTAQSPRHAFAPRQNISNKVRVKRLCWTRGQAKAPVL